MADTSDMNSPVRTALRKCISRRPHQGVALTDEEVRALFDYLLDEGRRDGFRAGLAVGRLDVLDDVDVTIRKDDR